MFSKLEKLLPNLDLLLTSALSEVLCLTLGIIAIPRLMLLVANQMTISLSINGLTEVRIMKSDFRHRALSHHSEGVWECQQVFGSILTLSTEVKVPVKLIAEQHILEDLNGQIPSLKDWLRLIQPQRWMSPPAKLLFGKANRNYPDIPDD